ncbi:DUF4235 domain-containing protein [Nocardia sp. NPDC048505]|uniref:DUF4235 domain-containing protein n=1 Tax=unclassified Nocardia TaxID=2637762 RepID=UPI0033D06CA5
MRTLYKPLEMAISVLGGLLAGAVFSKVWGLLTGEDEAPDATARDHGWREVLAAAALQGAIFGLVRAALNRASATGYQSVTGTWPR